jgi:hypothetical protein
MIVVVVIDAFGPLPSSSVVPFAIWWSFPLYQALCFGQVVADILTAMTEEQRVMDGLQPEGRFRYATH